MKGALAALAALAAVGAASGGGLKSAVQQAMLQADDDQEAFPAGLDGAAGKFQLKLEMDGDCEADVSLTNGDDREHFVLMWDSPFENPILNKVLRGADGSAEVEYAGPIAEHGQSAIDEASVRTMAAGASVTNKINLCELLHFKTAGTHRVEAFMDLMLIPVENSDELASALADDLTEGDTVQHVLVSNAVEVTRQEATAMLEEHEESTQGNVYYGGIKYVGCSESRRRETHAALVMVRKQIPLTRGEMPGGTFYDGGDTAEASKWFGSSTRSQLVPVGAGFQRMSNAASGTGFEFHCRSDCESRVLAYVYPSRTSTKPIYMCDLLYKYGTRTIAKTISHEFSHFNDLGNTDDVAYGTTAVKNLARDDPAAARRNADNWEHAADCLVDGNLCLLGTSCKNCCSHKHAYWFSKAFTACGSEPCWGNGKVCGLGTTCKKWTQECCVRQAMLKADDEQESFPAGLDGDHTLAITASTTLSTRLIIIIILTTRWHCTDGTDVRTHARGGGPGPGQLRSSLPSVGKAARRVVLPEGSGGGRSSDERARRERRRLVRKTGINTMVMPGRSKVWKAAAAVTATAVALSGYADAVSLDVRDMNGQKTMLEVDNQGKMKAAAGLEHLEEEAAELVQLTEMLERGESDEEVETFNAMEMEEEEDYGGMEMDASFGGLEMGDKIEDMPMTGEEASALDFEAMEMESATNEDFFPNIKFPLPKLPTIPSASVLKIVLPGNGKILTLCEVVAMSSTGTKLNLFGSKQSSDYRSNTGAAQAHDGNTAQRWNWSSNRCTHTNTESNPYWQASMLGTPKTIKIYNRMDCCTSRILGAKVYLGGNLIYTIGTVQPIYTITVGGSRGGMIPTPPPIPATPKPGATCSLTNAEKNKKMLGETETNAKTCSDGIGVASTVVSTAKTSVSVIEKATGVADRLVNKISSALSKISSALNKVAPLAKAIPGYGKIISMAIKGFSAFTKALAKVKTILNKVYDMFKKFLSGLEKAATVLKTSKYGTLALSKASGLAETAVSSVITCVKTTGACTDDDALEIVSTAAYPNVVVQHGAMKGCATVFNAIKSALQKVADALKSAIMDAIAKVLEAVEKVLTPIIDAIQKIIDAINKALTEAQCCVLPYASQVIGKTLSNAIDLVSCPVDGLFDALFKEVEKLVSTVKNNIMVLIKNLIKPILNLMRKATIQLPELSWKSEKCRLGKPSLSMKTVNPFQDILDYPFPSETQSITFSPNVLGNIKQQCSDALKAFNKDMFDDCCVALKGYLNDGDFCDPTGNVPYKRCTMCRNGDFEFWVHKFHTACGQQPCLNDKTICALGTSCNDCCNGHSYWYSKASTRCGKEACWKDGAICALGTTCKACCNGNSYWAKKAFTACGHEPCWSDGAHCALGTTCKECCNKAGYWYGKAFTACGSEPCWRNKRQLRKHKHSDAAQPQPRGERAQQRRRPRQHVEAMIASQDRGGDSGLGSPSDDGCGDGDVVLTLDAPETAEASGGRIGEHSDGRSTHVRLEHQPQLSFDQLVASDVGAIRRLHEQVFPVSYNDKFYDDLAERKYRDQPLITMVVHIAGDDKRDWLLSAHRRNQQQEQETPNMGQQRAGQIQQHLQQQQQQQQQQQRRRHDSIDESVVGGILAQLRPLAADDSEQPVLAAESRRAGLTKGCYLLTLATAKILRRMGIASRLIQHAEQEATRDPACGVLYLHVITYNDAAIQFYEHHGFVRVRVLHDFYKIEGKLFDAFLYANRVWHSLGIFG
ncbi:Extracellular protease [Durusdinium trenchii]|uniref:N-alpha-acetyltransferase 60 n=1 Tax=Durusdinium trenchii TaxID=1381693 RepID=A0ABP0HKJ6_9DINO